MTLYGRDTYTDTAYEGVVYKKDFEVYLDTSTGTTTGPVQGAGVDMGDYPYIVVACETPDGTILRGSGNWSATAAPAAWTLEILDTELDKAVAEDATTVTVSAKAGDLEGNEVTLIGRGTLIIERTAL